MLPHPLLFWAAGPLGALTGAPAPAFALWDMVDAAAETELSLLTMLGVATLCDGPEDDQSMSSFLEAAAAAARL